MAVGRQRPCMALLPVFHMLEDSPGCGRALLQLCGQACIGMRWA